MKKQDMAIKRLPYGRQDISEEDICAVEKVLRSDWLTQGPMVPAFEEEVVRITGAEYAVAVNSATSALHIACLAVGLGQGDWLWTSPISFVASSNCGLYCGAKIDFVDIDPSSWNIDPLKLEEKLLKADVEGRLPKVVVAVHLAGVACPMKEIKELGVKYGFSIIEDASHALGTYSADSKVGDCQYSDITVFSFHPVKTVTTGEGGVATTRSKALAQRMELLRTHGITRDEEQFQQVIDGAWHYEQIVLGFNYRMTDIAAALGVSQLGRLNEFINRRADLADLYCRLLRGSELPVQMQKVDDSVRVSRHLFIIRLDFSKLSQQKNDVVARLLNDGVTTTVHYRPIYLQPYYHQLGFPEGYAAEAEKYYAQALSLPLYPALEDSDIERVVSALVSAVR